ncbi:MULTISPECIES: lipid-A-disaccharide synthase [unclassified Robiginitalea]|mgnify:FL=1|uniref:lipid-A-disaccharide synthase n=1 Tax=Robiginitalea TaxID=252306 RepID=UPI00234BDF14|nr:MULTISPECIES: lipid-A-disaccharide synthase [unclassified Robiginitalea]MDC6355577.1 lipid-A-disaccharide synthase [Robiginitalea sp. PM2]MDC6375988.1 lipid-A-disaccharide synthase [Robiginitalea sp. SP8]
MKYYIIAGEASGDLHGSNLIRGLRARDPEADIRCWGGDRMEQAGGTLVRHYRELSFMGFLEVLRHLPAIFRNIAFCKKDIARFRPDALIFIDFSGFNLRIARWAKENGFRTHYYIAPQVWASREGRVKKIRRDIDHIYAILPFEKPFYEEKHGIPVHFVGHPLIDAMEGLPDPDPAAFRKRNNLDPERPILALLPGSRKQEIEKILPVMMAVIPEFPDYQCVIAGAPSLEAEQYEPYLTTGATLIRDQTYPLLQHAHAALVTSGTATLETALLGVPQVVCYKGGWVSYQIARRLIRLEYISLVNLIMDREVVPELIQHELEPQKLAAALRNILKGPGRESQLKAYGQLREKLGGPGASVQAAELIVNFSRET